MGERGGVPHWTSFAIGWCGGWGHRAARWQGFWLGRHVILWTYGAAEASRVEWIVPDFMKKMLEFYTNINPGLMPEGMQPPLTCAGRTGEYINITICAYCWATTMNLLSWNLNNYCNTRKYTFLILYTNVFKLVYLKINYPQLNYELTTKFQSSGTLFFATFICL